MLPGKGQKIFPFRRVRFSYNKSGEKKKKPKLKVLKR